MSSETKWTPGPWNVAWPMAAGLGMSRPGIDAGGQSIIEAGAEDDECGVFGYTPQECDANARLIAASPKLYEALERLLKFCESVVTDEYEGSATDEADFARTTLASARGEG